MTRVRFHSWRHFWYWRHNFGTTLRAGHLFLGFSQHQRRGGEPPGIFFFRTNLTLGARWELTCRTFFCYWMF